MKNAKLSDVTGRFVKDSVEWLRKEDCGCCSVCYASDDRYRYCVCVGWHDTGDGWAVAWKIGRQTHDNVMQCDLDVDFEMPYDEYTGDVDDTLRVVECDPTAMKEWNAIASEMRKEARRVFREWRLPASEED